MVKCETYTLDLEVNFSTEWMPAQIEEGHGLHDVGSYNNLEIGSIYIKLNDNEKIDITAQLNEITKKAIFAEILENL